MAIYRYVRVSTTRHVEESESLDIQARITDGYALMKGWRIDRTFRDEQGFSGSKPLETRPAGRELLDPVQSGDTIVAAKLDRMFRSALDALDVLPTFRRAAFRYT